MKRSLLLLPILHFTLTLLTFGQKTSTTSVRFHSSDTALENAFSWAKDMALHYKGAPEDTVGPWYESALPPRSAFCMRDVSHQCIGAEILGMHRQNRNMFTKFTSNISASKDWCSYWEIDKFDRPSPADYRNDREFWYNLNANFDIMDACWRSYLWTGDTLYLKDPAFQHFYDKSAHEYIQKWILQPDSLLTRPAYPNAPVPFNIEDAFHRCRGLPSYSEGVPNLKMGVDLVAALYRGLSSYAAIRQANGDLSTADDYRQKANAYQDRIDADWWDNGASLYHTWYSNNQQFGQGEGETFLLWFDALKDTARKRLTIQHIQSMDLNVENLSYLPLQYYRNGYWHQAYDLILHLANPSTQRREYPEVSYGLIEAVVQGLMGVDANATTRTVSTLYRPGKAAASPSKGSALPKESTRPTGEAQLTDLPILNTTITISHFDKTQSSIINTGQYPIKWKARFMGDYSKAIVTALAVGKVPTHGKFAAKSSILPLKKETDQQGQVISWLEMEIAPGQELNVRVR